MFTSFTRRHRWSLLLGVASLVVAGRSPADDAPAPVQLTAQEDHKRLMELLGIKELRQGANGLDPKQPTPPTMTNPRPTLTPICPTRS